MSLRPAPPEAAPAGGADSSSSSKLHPKYAATDETAGAAAETAPAPPSVESARATLQAFLKATRAAQLYPRQSRVRAEAFGAFRESLDAHLRLHGETVLHVKQFEIHAFGAAVYAEPSRSKSLAFRLFVNGIRSVTLRPGLTPEEAEGVVEVLTLAFRADAAGEEIQTSVWERCFVHASFEIQEEAFAEDDADEFRGFLNESEADELSAEAARQSEESVWEVLDALPPESGDDAAPWSPSPADTARLEELRRREDERDLFEETAAFLVQGLQSGDAERIRAPLEDFFGHVLAAGDVLRAARLLAALRRLAASAQAGAGARALADVVERIGRTHIVPALVPLAPSLTPADREGFTMLLTAIGEPAVGPVLDLLSTDARELALHALRALAPRHPQVVRAMLADPRPDVARTLVPLVASSARDVASALAPALGHPDPGVRRDALRTIAAAAGPGTTGLFLAQLDDPVYEIRATALDALGAARDSRAVPRLLARIEALPATASPFERRELFRAVGRIGGPSALSALSRILGSSTLFRRIRHDDTRALAAAALALTGESGAQSALERHVKDRSDVVRRAVQQALRDIGAAPRQ